VAAAAGGDRNTVLVRAAQQRRHRGGAAREGDRLGLVGGEPLVGGVNVPLVRQDAIEAGPRGRGARRELLLVHEDLRRVIVPAGVVEVTPGLQQAGLEGPGVRAAAPAGEEYAKIPVSDAAEKRPESPPIRILLAEDNPVNQKLARLMLAKAGCEVDVASNGREAFEKFTATPERFRLIFMDIQMPVMDGIEATKMIRARGFSTIPVIAMTARAMKGDRELCLEAGMTDYITKPIRRETVLAAIEKYAAHREAV
jgi:CheY-like chemotaxis protein